MSRVDDEGQCWDIVIGAVVGGIIGGMSTAINDNITGKGFSWDSVITGVAIGAGNGIICASVSAKGMASVGCFVATTVISLSTGSSFGESLLAGGTAAMAALVSVPFTNMISAPNSSFIDAMAKGIASGTASSITEGLSTAGRGIGQGLKNTNSHPSNPSAVIKPSYLSVGKNKTFSHTIIGTVNKSPMLK